MYSVINDTAVAIIAKVGTQSFADAGADWYISNREALIYPTRVMFVREPIERLQSCFWFFRGLRDSGTTYTGFDFKHLESWRVFVDYMLTNDDEHWTPQCDSVLNIGELTPTTYLKFDDVEKWFPVYFQQRLGHENASQWGELDLTYRIDELLTYYSKDTELYNLAKRYEGEQWPLP